MAQSLFQVGGNAGTAIGPLLAALVIVKYGRNYTASFGIAALLAMVILFMWVAGRARLLELKRKKTKGDVMDYHPPFKTRCDLSVAILLVLVFQVFYLSSISSYMRPFLSISLVCIKTSQIFCLFILLQPHWVPILVAP